MDLRLAAKAHTELLATRLVQQSSLWGGVKKRTGWTPRSFDLWLDGKAAGDVLILERGLADGASLAYVPFGPEALPDEDRRGEYLRALSAELRPLLGDGCVMIRWDLPWESPYAGDEDRYDDQGHWLGPPEPRLRELRMNWGADGEALRKAASDILPPDTMLVDLRGEEDAILSRMKPKTRYNIRLAARRGVSVRRGGPEDLGLWMGLYAQTARRKGIHPHGSEHFSAIFDELGHVEHKKATIRMLVAERDGEPLAAMFMSVSADLASYLYGASSDAGRDCMGPYALQWEAMRAAKAEGCSAYDLFGVPPRPDPSHPMHGLYAFKAGFGGRMLHRQGAWDYAYDRRAYELLAAREATELGYHQP